MYIDEGRIENRHLEYSKVETFRLIKEIRKGDIKLQPVRKEENQEIMVSWKPREESDGKSGVHRELG